MKFTCAGDALIQKRIPLESDIAKNIKNFVEKGEARFFNLETTLNKEGSCCGNQFSGGTYVRTDKKMLDDLIALGFNMTSFNNNHAFDFNYEGLKETLSALDESGIVHAGVGKNLDEASAPAYLETASGRVALISVNTSFKPSAMAGIQSRRYPGRYGINGLRIKSAYSVTQKDIDYLNDLAKRTGANIENDLDRAAGYLAPLPADEAEFGDIRFKSGEKEGIIQSLNKDDMERIKKSIIEASFMADYTIVSIHTHQISEGVTENTPKFMEEFAHACIDAGANAVIGHGPHVLRAIEVYKDSPIFYSLGDFIIQLYSVPSAPEDFYAKIGLDSSKSIYELLKTRSNNFSRGLMEKDKYLEAVIPYFEMENKKLTKLELLPIKAIRNGTKSEMGLPEIAKDLSFIDRLQKLSEPYGISLKINENGTVSCKW